MVNAAERVREEEHFRKVVGAMFYAEDAARRLSEEAAVLKKEGAAGYLVTALEAAAGAVPEEHRQPIKVIRADRIIAPSWAAWNWGGACC